ncbi:MAG: transposase, partial [Methylococcaceae bacterium]
VFSRLEKGSKNRSKQKMVVAKLHEKVANARYDFIHKSSYNVAVKNHATTVCIEDLQISNMIRNPKLARHIANCGWGMWATALAYKLAEHGKNLIRISPFAPSSKECRKCHNKHTGLVLSDRVFVCPMCNHTEDRDLHASHNIKRFGLQKEFEAAGSVVTVKRSLVSTRVKARDTARGTDKNICTGRSKPPLERDSV